MEDIGRGEGRGYDVDRGREMIGRNQEEDVIWTNEEEDYLKVSPY